MEPIITSFLIMEQPDNFGPGPIHDAYLSAATGLMGGATVLAAAPPSEGAWAFALVSGQILECSLKAFLSKAGVTQEDLRNKFRHNLSKLWAEAADQGLPIGDMPQWAETLNSLHYRTSLDDPPYPVRYPEGLNVLVLTDAQQTETALRNLIDTVRKGMNAL
jgi:hypothetical protein